MRNLLIIVAVIFASAGRANGAYQERIIRHLMPQVTNIEALPKLNSNWAFRVQDSSKKFYFVKVYNQSEEKWFLRLEDIGFTKFFLSRHEASSSALANFISSGLVPKGEVLENVIVYPFQEIDKAKTSQIFPQTYPEHHFVNVYHKLNSVQRRDLFLNMLADMVLMNPDSHSMQFAITKEGRLVGFDKGRSYFDVFQSAPLTHIEMPDNFLSKSTIYRDFIAELKNDPKELKLILNDSLVQESFEKIASLDQKVERSRVEKLLEP
ncbi:MAG: hypothetical protein WCK49_11360, partial [Myxococcaceae bacterium]